MPPFDQAVKLILLSDREGFGMQLLTRAVEQSDLPIADIFNNFSDEKGRIIVRKVSDPNADPYHIPFRLPIPYDRTVEQFRTLRMVKWPPLVLPFSGG